MGRSFGRRLRSPEVFADFYEAESPRVLRFHARRVFDPEVAIDLTSETFAEALASVGRLRAKTRDEAVSWLFSIARHQLAHFHERGRVARDARRRLGLERIELNDSEIERIEELAGLEELRAAVRTELAALSTSEREAVELRVVEELHYAEVAARLGVSEDAARARVSRGLRAMTKALTNLPSEEPT